MPVSHVDPSPSQHAGGASPPEGYTVKSGDTLTGIAQAHGVSLQALEAANPHILHPDLIFPGQHVNVHAGGGEPKVGAASQEVTVKAGDTLSGIAGKLGVDWRTMAQVNHLSNPNLIRPGERLEVPGHGQSRGGGDVAPTHHASGSSTAGGTGQHAYDIAKSYLGRNASSLKTDTHDKLHMDPGISSEECCANFVSAVLVQAGQLPASKHTNSVEQLKTTLETRGWTKVDAAHAQPGDVVIMQRGISHTEMVAGNDRMIGSNNTNADGSQKVGYESLAYAKAHGAIFLRAPGGATPAPKAAPSNGVGKASGTEAGRRQQAVSYFETHGWTHAQAAGIAANLQTESGYRTGAVGDGGSAYGLAQWHPDRQAGFEQHFGHSIRGASYGEQLEYVNYELHHTESSAGDRLKGAGSAAEAGAIVSRYYERPADASGEASRRGALAHEIAGETH